VFKLLKPPDDFSLLIYSFKQLRQVDWFILHSKQDIGIDVKNQSAVFAH
jgi:hypothetical protein